MMAGTVGQCIVLLSLGQNEDSLFLVNYTVKCFSCRSLLKCKCGPHQPTSCRVQKNDFSTEPTVVKKMNWKTAYLHR